jgi:hypothetical protein
MRNRWLLLLLLVAMPGWSKAEDRPPLPKSLVQGKTVFLRDQTGGYGTIFTDAYKSLKKWNRFQFTDDPKDADLVFVVVYSETYMGDVGFRAPKTRDVRESTVLNILDHENRPLMSIAADSFFSVNGGTSVVNQLRQRLEPKKK